MEYIDESKLESDLQYRFAYVSKFVGFGEKDIKMIKNAATFLEPLVPVIVDKVYEKLFSFDVTKKVFLIRNEGFAGDLPDTLEHLTLESDQIQFRKNFLEKYLKKLVTGNYNENFIKYLDWVGKIHVDTPDKKSRINVNYIHVNALFGFVHASLEDIILSSTKSRNPGSIDALDDEIAHKTVCAFSKLLWIQNDLFAKYYCTPIYRSKSRWASILQTLTSEVRYMPVLSLISVAIAGFIIETKLYKSS
ncbi:uncharacterized protein VTP21DRAFT_7784 [Calcarisporiella thermophila]|uniref:uncharacterized protein n=1 Tax=Calcarisporiella thermophila TaxID=911321 RepID=UPI003743E2E1